VAILSGSANGEDIGVGAILGAPFMLTTLAMVVIGVTVVVVHLVGRRDLVLRFDGRAIRQDLGYFLVMYSLAMLAGLVHSKAVDYGFAIVLVVGYGYYVRRHFLMPDDEALAEIGEDVRPLYLWSWVRRFRQALPAWTKEGPAAVPFVQVGVALALIVGGAEMFVGSVGSIADTFGLPALAFSLLVAPLATELPEKFNSVLWIRRRKDTLAMGNMTGAMVFQSSFPVTIGLLLTPWELAHEALVAACIALAAGAVLYGTLRVRGRLTGPMLLLQGIFYVGYVAYVITKL
jgi:cation:H+ antiporter